LLRPTQDEGGSALSDQIIPPEDQPITGSAEIARALNRNKREVEYLIKQKRIPVKRMGKRLVTTPRALKAAFAVEAEVSHE
jgi:hypothetical protein